MRKGYPPRYRGSGGFPHWAGSGGFPHWALVVFSGGFPHWCQWVFPHWTFNFWLALRSPRPRAPGDHLGLFDCLDAPPFVGRLLMRSAETIGEPIQGRLPIIGIARAPLPGDRDEAEAHSLTDRRRYSVPLNSEFDEVIKRTGEPAVFLGLAAMAIQLDLEALEDPLGREAHDPASRTFEHLD